MPIGKYQHDKEICLINLGKGMLGKMQSEYQKNKMKEIHTGKIISQEHREKIRNALKGIKPQSAWKKGHTPWNKNKKIPELIGNQRGFKKGQRAWNYIDGRSKYLTTARYGDDWDKIRYLVYSRDKFCCQNCGINQQKLDVHHKIPFLVSFDNSLDNLITLCRPCHRKEEAKLMRELKNKPKMVEV